MFMRYSGGAWWAVLVVSVALVVHAGSLLQAKSNSLTPVDNAAFVDRYLDVADEIDPVLADRLRSMCALDQDRFGRVLRQLGPALAELTDMRDTDPELFWRKIRELHLEATIESMAAQLRSLDARGLADEGMKAQLKALVEAQLSASMDTHQLYLQRMRRELARAEASLGAEIEDFHGEVDDRVERLLQR